MKNYVKDFTRIFCFVLGIILVGLLLMSGSSYVWDNLPNMVKAIIFILLFPTFFAAFFAFISNYNKFSSDGR